MSRILGACHLHNKLSTNSELPPSIELPGCKQRLWPKDELEAWLRSYIVNSVPNSPQTSIHKSLITDERLSWSTRAIIIYLLNRTYPYFFGIDEIIEKGDLGRDAVYKRITEAIKYGYVTRANLRDNKGRMSGIEYAVFPDSLFKE